MSTPGCWTTGLKNKSLSFNSSNDRVEITALTGNITSVCFWMKENVMKPINNTAGPFVQANNDSTGFQFRICYFSNSIYSLKIGGAG